MTNDQIKQSYDEVLYSSGCYIHSNIHHLQSCALMSGRPAADPSRCRVLEIGCAAGGNILGQAVNNPQSTFLGVDLSSKQIDIAIDAAHKMGLKNIEFVAMDVSDFSDRFGEAQFDYIIAHGVYSWVPAPVQRAILQICQKHLSGDGVAMISFNTYPGWKLIEPVRDFMLFSAAFSGDGAGSLQAALNGLTFQKAAYNQINPSTKSKNLYPAICRELNLYNISEVMGYENRSYVTHEYMELNNHPFYLVDFVADAQDFGLEYLNDAQLKYSFREFSDEAVQTYARLHYPTNYARDQLFDFLYSTRFRFAVLAKKSDLPPMSCDEKELFENIKGKHIAFASWCPWLLDLAKNQPIEEFIKRLIKAYPASISVDDLLSSGISQNDIATWIIDLYTTEEPLHITPSPLQNIIYEPGKTRLKPQYNSYLQYFLDHPDSIISIANPYNFVIDLENRIQIEAVLCFDGKNSIKDIAKFILNRCEQTGFKLKDGDKKQKDIALEMANAISKMLSSGFMIQRF